MLIKNPYGFRQGHSTYVAIMDMYDKTSASMNRNEYSVGVFIDLSKAFDTLDQRTFDWKNLKITDYEASQISGFKIICIIENNMYF